MCECERVLKEINGLFFDMCQKCGKVYSLINPCLDLPLLYEILKELHDNEWKYTSTT
jgi:hypothetical protein